MNGEPCNDPAIYPTVAVTFNEKHMKKIRTQLEPFLQSRGYAQQEWTQRGEMLTWFFMAPRIYKYQLDSLMTELRARNFGVDVQFEQIDYFVASAEEVEPDSP